MSVRGLTPDEVRAVARLARLALTDEQVAAYGERLGAVLGYAERIGELDLTGVEPLVSPLEESARLAEDVPGATLPTEVLMRMAPATMPPFVRVPKVVGGGGG